jgi:putative membrane protein
VMDRIAQLFIGLTALLHLLFFKLESLDFMNPEVLSRFGLNEQNAEFVRVWAFNQGFYNLFLALGLLYSFFLIYFKKKSSGVLLCSFILLTIVGAGIVLFFSAPQKYLAALIQTVPALLGLIFLRISGRKPLRHTKI